MHKKILIGIISGIAVLCIAGAIIFLQVNGSEAGNNVNHSENSGKTPKVADDVIDTEDSGGFYKLYSDLIYTEIAGVDSNLISLDIYTPGSDKKHPIMVFIHGGGWKTGDKANVKYKPEAFTSKGYIFVSINYRLSPAVQHPVHVQDVASALSWLYHNADNYSGNPAHMVIMGHSAGAHLAALVATDDSYLKEKDLTPGILSGVVLLDGAGYDIPRLMGFNEKIYGPLYEPAFGKDNATWTNASPVTHVAVGKDIPPFLLIYVGNRIASKFESNWLAQELQEAGVSAEVICAQDKTHKTLNQELGEPGDEITGKIFDFLDKFN